MADGDSITNQNGLCGCSVEGCVNSCGNDANRYADQTLTLMGLTGSVSYSNPSVGGERCDTREGFAPTDVDAHYSRNQKFNVVSFQCGINDYKQGTTDPNVTYSRMTQYVKDRKGAGWNYVLLLTVEDDAAQNLGDQTAWQTYRHSLNTLIRNGAASHGYIVVDVAADAQVGCDGCALSHCGTNQAVDLFRDDSNGDSCEHLTVAGGAIFAGYIQTALNSIGFK